MVKKEISLRMVGLPLAIVVCMAVGLIGVNEYKRKSLLVHQTALLQTLTLELEKYKKLGFVEEDALVQLTRARIVYAQEQLTQLLQKRIVIVRNRAFQTAEKERIETVIEINKKLAQECAEQLANATAQGKQEQLKTQLTTLVRDITELERGGFFYDGRPIAEKIFQTLAYNRQALLSYEQQMVQYKSQGLPESDAAVQDVKKHIAVSMAHHEKLERTLAS